MIPSDSYGITVNKSIKGEERFKIIIDAVVLQNDKFQLYFKDSFQNEFSPDKMIEASVTGGQKPQKIVYTFSPEVVPTQIRLDFGINYSQRPIKVNYILIRYGRKEFIFDKEKFAQLFKGNIFTEFIIESYEIRGKIIEDSYDPHFTSVDLDEIMFQLME
ncbi:MAG: hypothetical protein V7724_03520 [Sediminicola sp.]